MSAIEELVTAGSARPPIVLVEVFADRAGGHWGDNLERLCGGAVDAGYDVTVVAVQGVHPQIRAGLEPLGVRMIDQPYGGGARAALGASRLLLQAHRVVMRVAADSSLERQLLYVVRGLAEVAALRTARVTAGRPVPTALLSASQALTATTATLGGTPHVRFVHEVGVPEHRLLRAAEWLCRRGMTLTVLVCTTDGVQAALAARHPELRSVVRTFTVADPSMYVSPDERVPARAALGIGEDEFVVAMIGGWWPYKDVDMVERALHKVTGPVTLVLVGKPSQPAALEPALQTSGSRSVVLQRPLTEAELRQVYAASDGALVTRVAGFDREASTIYDAARYGVPMIVTDHHPRMTERLAHEPWAHVVPAGDDVTLAAALDELARGDTPRPDPEAPTRLGLFTGEETIGVIADLAAGLPSSSA